MTTTDTVTPSAATQVRLATVPVGSTIAWTAPMPSSDNPQLYMHVGCVGRAIGESRLGNQGFVVDRCPCGFSHSVSRYQPVIVLNVPTTGAVIFPVNPDYYDDDANV